MKALSSRTSRLASSLALASTLLFSGVAASTASAAIVRDTATTGLTQTGLKFNSNIAGQVTVAYDAQSNQDYVDYVIKDPNEGIHGNIVCRYGVNGDTTQTRTFDWGPNAQGVIPQRVTTLIPTANLYSCSLIQPEFDGETPDVIRVPFSAEATTAFTLETEGYGLYRRHADAGAYLQNTIPGPFITANRNYIQLANYLRNNYPEYTYQTAPTRAGVVNANVWVLGTSTADAVKFASLRSDGAKVVTTITHDSRSTVTYPN